MKKLPPLLPLPDYQVIYSVLEASEIARTHRACILFTIAGTLILREHYNLPATISAGCMGIMLDEKSSAVVTYGRMENAMGSDDKAFHAWVECRGWLIDFMAPIMGVALKEDGHSLNIPRRMLQKPLNEQKASIHDLIKVGDFCIEHNPALAESLIDSQAAGALDLANICKVWFRRPPKILKPLAMASNQARPINLILKGPAVEGVW